MEDDVGAVRKTDANFVEANIGETIDIAVKYVREDMQQSCLARSITAKNDIKSSP